MVARLTEPWQIYAGDHAVLEVRVTNADGTPQDLTGLTWQAQWRTRADATDAQPIFLDTSQAAAGVLRLSLSAEQTRAMGRAGVFDVQQVGGPTLVAGTTSWTQDVTR